MKQVKVSETTDTTLDWLVAKALGELEAEVLVGKATIEAVIVDDTGSPFSFRIGEYFKPSTNWNQGGPIIEQEDISVIKLEHEYGLDSKGFTTAKRIPVFGAVVGEYFDTDQQRNSYGEAWGEIYYMSTELVVTGPTPLIAAMRCYVVSKLGNTAEVPDELVGSF